MTTQKTQAHCQTNGALVANTPQNNIVTRQSKPDDTVISVRNVEIGGLEPVVIAGPCAVENYDQLLSTAQAVKKSGAKILRGGAFKPRSSPYSFQGLQEKGLKMLALTRKETGLPIVTEVMDARHVEMVCEYSDILQIGSRNIQNFTLLHEVGLCDKPVLLKRGMALTVEEFLLAAEHVVSQGNQQVILCERGIRTFEPSTRFTLDLNAVPMLKRLSHLPVIADPSHGTGIWWMVPPLAKAAIAVGADGLIVEVHSDPDKALCDGDQSLRPDKFESMMQEINAVANAVGRKKPALQNIPETSPNGV